VLTNKPDLIDVSATTRPGQPYYRRQVSALIAHCGRSCEMSDADHPVRTPFRRPQRYQMASQSGRSSAYPGSAPAGRHLPAWAELESAAICIPQVQRCGRRLHLVHRRIPSGSHPRRASNRLIVCGSAAVLVVAFERSDGLSPEPPAGRLVPGFRSMCQPVGPCRGVARKRCDR
jgi:hypothetical protein